MVFETLLDPVLRPLLSLDPFLAVFLISFILTLGITLVYKYATDQERMRHLKAKTKQFQEKVKKVSKESPEKAMKIQQEAMSVQMELMKHSFKPTLYTLIPILLIFGWLNAHMAYHNIAPGEEFTITAEFVEGFSGNVSLDVLGEGVEVLNGIAQPISEGKAAWSLKGEEGTFKAVVTSGGQTEEKRFLITTERRYEPPLERYKGAIKEIRVSNRPVHPLPFSLFGWEPGWLGTYIILSLVMSLLMRKLMKVV